MQREQPALPHSVLEHNADAEGPKAGVLRELHALGQAVRKVPVEHCPATQLVLQTATSQVKSILGEAQLPSTRAQFSADMTKHWNRQEHQVRVRSLFKHRTRRGTTSVKVFCPSVEGGVKEKRLSKAKFAEAVQQAVAAGELALTAEPLPYRQESGRPATTRVGIKHGGGWGRGGKRSYGKDSKAKGKRKQATKATMSRSHKGSHNKKRKVVN